MAKKNDEWVKFTTRKKPEKPVCRLTIRSNGQFVLNEATMSALAEPEYVNLYANMDNNLVAIHAIGKDDPDAIKVNRGKGNDAQTGQFVNMDAYRWVCGLVERQDVRIGLSGKAEGERVVFDLSKADIKDKRVINRTPKE